MKMEIGLSRRLVQSVSTPESAERKTEFSCRIVTKRPIKKVKSLHMKI